MRITKEEPLKAFFWQIQVFRNSPDACLYVYVSNKLWNTTGCSGKQRYSHYRHNPIIVGAGSVQS
jgi:hypothetical protein